MIRVGLILLLLMCGSVVEAKEAGKLYSVRVRPGSGGGEVERYLLARQKDIVGTSIVASGRVREVAINGKRRVRTDTTFTVECAFAPTKESTGKVLMMYGNGDMQMIDLLADDVSMADQHHHDLWNAACKGKFFAVP